MKLIFTVFAALFVLSLKSQNVFTVAGDSNAGFSGDGVPATATALASPYDVLIDASGNIYLSDEYDSRIRKVSISTGLISTIAGTGVQGYNGDGIQATSAQLYNPSGIMLDKFNGLYIGDKWNLRIRKVDLTTGMIETFAGNGAYGYTGDGGAASLAEIGSPSSVTTDSSGNIFITDRDFAVIRKVNKITGFITTIAGNGTPGFSGDGGLAVFAELNAPNATCIDASGNLYISDSENGRIREVFANTGVINTIAGNGFNGYSGDGGSPMLAEIQYPYGLCLDKNSNIFIADWGNCRIRKFNLSGGMISTVAGDSSRGFTGDGGIAVNASMNGPTGVFVDHSGNIYFADNNNNRIRKVSSVSGIDELINSSGNIRIYPNPNRGNFTIQLIGQSKKSLLEIYSVFGEEIKSYVLTESATRVDLSEEPAGVYFYKTLSDDGKIQSNGKILIQK